MLDFRLPVAGLINRPCQLARTLYRAVAKRTIMRNRCKWRVRRVLFRDQERFAGEHIDAPNAEFERGTFLGRAAEAVKTMGETDVAKPHPPQRLNELCLRQSAGDSARPQVNIPAHVFPKLRLDGDIGQLQPASRPIVKERLQETRSRDA